MVYHYRHNLGKSFVLDAFAISPSLSQRELETIVRLNQSNRLYKDDAARFTYFLGMIESIDSLNFNIVPGTYEVPLQLQHYRDALEHDAKAKKMHNGPIAVVEGGFSINNPIRLIQGWYFDFLATNFKAIPHRLIPDKYPPGKTVEELFKNCGIPEDKRARFFSVAYVVMAKDGKELSFVQRAKNLGINANCICSPGSTPSPILSETNFDMCRYFKQHVLEEMFEEYKMEENEFRIGKLWVFDDEKEVPRIATEIHTSLTTEELAIRNYNHEKAVKEHPILYAIEIGAIPQLLGKCCVLPPIAKIFKTVYQDHI